MVFLASVEKIYLLGSQGKEMFEGFNATEIKFDDGFCSFTLFGL